MQIVMSRLQIALAAPRWALMVVNEVSSAMTIAYDACTQRIEMDLYGVSSVKAEPTRVDDDIRIPARTTARPRVGDETAFQEVDEYHVEDAATLVESMSKRANDLMKQITGEA